MIVVIALAVQIALIAVAIEGKRRTAAASLRFAFAPTEGVRVNLLLARLESSATRARRVGGRIVDAGIDAVSALLEKSQLHDWDVPHTHIPARLRQFEDTRVQDMAAVLLEHHAITEPTEFADVVVACACDPVKAMDGVGWAAHVIVLFTQISAAVVPPCAADAEKRRAPVPPRDGARSTLHTSPAVAAGVRPAPGEEAGAGRSLWFHPST